ncbi:hypothetical protein CL633_00795 [bacterium]|nr:hypothetical protein [bacterium]|tara:strand:- start:1081 stop:1503 length:423 start_codon:yes stop_codon:yes gene_type:complete
MIDKKFIQNKIKFIQDELENLSQYHDFSFEDIVGDYNRHTIVERILERIINEAIDINQHISAESEKIKIPDNYKDTFLILVELDIFPKEFADVISRSVGLRNILVHHYGELDEKMFYQSIKACLKDYTKYCDYILKYIEN